jgi:oxygen-independent coproporphyrinogen-3 oxidase
MSGIYIHIPFCKQACYYCDFHFSTSLKHKDKLIQSIIKEIDIKKDEWKNTRFETIYFGGGTPSLVEIEDIEKILNKLYKVFSIEATEITLEGNPDDLSLKKLKAYKNLGINRLSVGIQSFFDEDLKKLNRSHNAKQAKKVLENIQIAGFDNFTLDLIYGIPGLTDEKWYKNIQTSLDFGSPHISAYALTVEEKTALFHLIKKKKIPPVSEEQSARQFEILRDQLQKNGFIHYEISNFARPGYYSKHNSLYWKNIPYLGLGPSAHSYTGNKRAWNVANNAIYIKKIENGNFYETEELTAKDRYNEKIMTGLRTIYGINTNELSVNEKNFLFKTAQSYIKQGSLIYNPPFLKANPEKLFIIEGVIADLFMD